MDNEYNRYYIKIRTILGIIPKMIHEEFATALEFKARDVPIREGGGRDRKAERCPPIFKISLAEILRKVLKEKIV